MRVATSWRRESRKKSCGRKSLTQAAICANTYRGRMVRPNCCLHESPAAVFPRACRNNRISPCKLRDLRVSVLKLLRKKLHHGGTQNTEKLFPTGSQPCGRAAFQCGKAPPEIGSILFRGFAA